MLQKLNTWDNFDVFAFGEITEGAPLKTMLLYLYHFQDYESLGVDPIKFRNFAEAVEHGYNNVSYHNNFHAAGNFEA